MCINKKKNFRLYRMRFQEENDKLMKKIIITFIRINYFSLITFKIHKISNKIKFQIKIKKNKIIKE